MSPQVLAHRPLSAQNGCWQGERKAQLSRKRIFRFWIYVKKRHFLKLSAKASHLVPDILEPGSRDLQMKRKPGPSCVQNRWPKRIWMRLHQSSFTRDQRILQTTSSVLSWRFSWEQHQVVEVLELVLQFLKSPNSDFCMSYGAQSMCVTMEPQAQLGHSYPLSFWQSRHLEFLMFSY